ncbi:MAG: response regulator [Bacteroidetes bacterium]|uniref:histidine kinase n=1 Tax=Candidatus Cryptobacteroides excrementipullorum TaxID=2840761 RepID=A0A9D9NMP8_9BACT|nr:response regulator [Candidatus Cryptobacteroides excrementipullorum]
MAVIGSMTAILLFDRARIREIEEESAEIRSVRRDINTVHRRITELATLGESVMAWDTTEYHLYHEKRMSVDTLLADLKQNCTGFVLPEQVDTLRMLLSDKEHHLYRIMKAFHRQEIADSLIAEQLPKVTSQATRTRTEIRRKKGIAGWFGKKDTVTIPVPAAPLHSLNERLISLQEKRIRDLDTYTDSLRFYNQELNTRLTSFITQLDGQAQTSFQYREQKLAEAQRHSFRLIAGLVGAAILLLIISHLIIMRDLRRREHDRNSLEDTLAQNRSLSDIRKKIIVTLSHDIRGPLNAISGSAELALDTKDRKRRNAHIENILESSRHILRLANSLLDLSRLDEAKEILNPVPFRLDSFLESISEEYTRPANDKGLLFSKDINVPDITVSGDADRMEQVIDNLLSNAIKFTRSGSINFFASYEKDMLTVRIQDTGIGMDEKSMERIFRPFERAAPEMDAEGFGLGLAITKGLVSLLKGEISVSSRLGEGTSFEIRIPLPRTDEPVKATAVPTEGRLALPRKVLVVDDDPIQLRIIGEMLERNGVFCCKCQSAQSVVNELRRTHYDIILTDIQMRGTGGFDLLYLLRHSNIGDSRTVPVAAMTARNDGDGCRYTDAGFAGCIRKPFSINELLTFMSSIMGKEKITEPLSADFSTLAADIEDRKWLLETFIEESHKNKAELQESLSDIEMNLGRMRETLHRIYPVWEQLGISHELEWYSEVLHDDDSDEDIIQRYTEETIARICGLIAEAERLLSETENEQ